MTLFSFRGVLKSFFETRYGLLVIIEKIVTECHAEPRITILRKNGQRGIELCNSFAQIFFPLKRIFFIQILFENKCTAKRVTNGFTLWMCFHIPLQQREII